MEDSDSDNSNFTPSHLVTLSPIPPTSSLNFRRLSSQFSKPSTPVQPKKLAWVSLQGRLVGAHEATSARAIGGCLKGQESVSWDLFSPIHRVLIVAVVAVATAKSEKNRQIIHLRNCVQLRDEILISMQQKLDDLCEQMNCIKDQPQSVADSTTSKALDFSSRRSSLGHKSDSVCSDCWFCDQRRADLTDTSGNTLVKAASGDEMFKNRLSTPNETEQEERRMSDLSDLASSVTSATDLQLNNLAIEQDTYNLKRECEEKDAAIKELSSFIRSKDVATSKKIEELEEVIRRKNTTITKLKKDMVVLEQKLVHLTRTRRRSFSGASMEKKQLPLLTDNLLYDMDSSTSPSSDSDCSSGKQTTSAGESAVVEARVNTTPVQNSLSCENVSKRNQKSAPARVSTSVGESAVEEARVNTTPVQNSLSCENVSKRNQKSAPAKVSTSSTKLSHQVLRPRPMTPLKEKSLNQGHYSADSSMLKQATAGAGLKNNRRRTQSGSKDAAASQKRWM